MVDVLVLTAGELVMQSNPTEWWRMTSGEIVPESGSGNPALQLSSGERITVTGPISITVDCAALNVCSVSDDGSCLTVSGCTLPGEQHRIEWDTTGCSDGSHHIALHRSVNGGSFVDLSLPELACAPSNPDVGCCETATCSEGQHLIVEFNENTNQTTDYQYRVRIQDDGTEDLAQAGSTLDTNTETDQGGDDACFEP